MSQFNYNDYQNAISRAQSNTEFAKVGFFKLSDDGDEALVRINCASVEDLQFASVHQLGAAQKWMKISCLNTLGTTGKCPLCNAANGDTSKGPRKRVFVQMMCSYKDKMTGQWSQAVPVIWERPAGFSKELCNKLRDYGDLRQVLLKITRNGRAGDMQTTYSMDYAVPTVFKPEMVPMDFSAFANFNINKHSYWEKTADEINTFLTTGSFPEVAKANTEKEAAPVQAQQVPVQPAYTAPAQTVVPPTFTMGSTGYTTAAVNTPVAVVTEQKPAEQPVQQPPVRSFEKFSF